MQSSTERLFSAEPRECDHRGYSNIRRSKVFPGLRGWCDEAYDRHRAELDRDFPNSFRRETPKRVSELFFADAFARAGWKPAGRVVGFDLAYRLAERRLLVEVVTPNPPSYQCWGEEEHNGSTVFTADERTTEANLLRLTGSFYSKAQRIAARLDADSDIALDYKVIAISGFHIGQETPFEPSGKGNVSDLMRALLPIGDPFVRIPIGPGSDEAETELHYQISSSLRKPSGEMVPQTAFIDGEFPHVDAVAYSPVNLLGLSEPHWQVEVLHNPTSAWPTERPDLGMGCERFVKLTKDDFEVTRRMLPGIPED